MLATSSARSLYSDVPLILPATLFTSGCGRDIIIDIVTVLVFVTLVFRGRNPQTGLPAVEGLVLAREVNTVVTVAALVAAALGEGTRTLRELRRNRSVL